MVIEILNYYRTFRFRQSERKLWWRIKISALGYIGGDDIRLRSVLIFPTFAVTRVETIASKSSPSMRECVVFCAIANALKSGMMVTPRIHLCCRRRWTVLETMDFFQRAWSLTRCYSPGLASESVAMVIGLK